MSISTRRPPIKTGFGAKHIFPIPAETDYAFTTQGKIAGFRHGAARKLPNPEQTYPTEGPATRLSHGLYVWQVKKKAPALCSAGAFVVLSRSVAAFDRVNKAKVGGAVDLICEDRVRHLGRCGKGSGGLGKASARFDHRLVAV